MAHNAPLEALPFQQRSLAQRSVLTEHQLVGLGVSVRVIADRCRPGGVWQQLLPQVYLLHPGQPTPEQRLTAALLYAGHGRSTQGDGAAPAEGQPPMITGLAALALHHFCTVPDLAELPVVDVLVPSACAPPDSGCARIRRSREQPPPVDLGGLSCAPVPRAVTDAVELLGDVELVRLVMIEAVGSGRCAVSALVRELDRAGLLYRPDVALVIDALLSEERALAEDALYALVQDRGLPDPVWNVSLHRPDGAFLATVDAYWPEQGVTLEIDVRSPGFNDQDWLEEAQRRNRLEALGLSVLYVTPDKLQESPELQASVVRAALHHTEEREPATLLLALPR